MEMRPVHNVDDDTQDVKRYSSAIEWTSSSFVFLLSKASSAPRRRTSTTALKYSSTL